jgi:hypothetical protein
MRLTERSLSARGSGSRVVVTEMLWVMVAGLFGDGAGAGDCWAAALRHRRQKGKKADIFFILL